jgi:hypothetical protein
MINKSRLITQIFHLLNGFFNNSVIASLVKQVVAIQEIM